MVCLLEVYSTVLYRMWNKRRKRRGSWNASIGWAVKLDYAIILHEIGEMPSLKGLLRNSTAGASELQPALEEHEITCR